MGLWRDHFPVTPPVVFAATSRTSDTPICWAAVTCSSGEQGVRRGIGTGQEHFTSRGTNGEEGEGVAGMASASASVDDRPE